MNDRLDISEIFLKGPLNPNQKNKNKKNMKCQVLFLSSLLLAWHDVGIGFSIRWSVFVRQSINICVDPNFDPNVQVHFLKNCKGYSDDT